MTLTDAAEDTHDLISVIFQDGCLMVLVIGTQFGEPEVDIGHPSAFDLPTQNVYIESFNATQQNRYKDQLTLQHRTTGI